MDDLDFIDEGPYEPVDVGAVPFVGPTARQVEERALVRVVSLRYENPLDMVILAGGVVVVYVLKMLREWSARRRLNNATATEYENGVTFREEVRSRVLAAIDNGTLPLSPDLVQSLLTDDVASSLGVLGDADLKVFGLPGTPDRQDS